MPNNRNNLRGLLAARAIIGAATLVYSLLFATPAHAQLAVSDAPTETNTGKIASDLSTTNSTLSNILTQDTSTARSVTTGGAAGAWQSNSGYLNSLASNLNNGISSVSLFNANFPGWLALPSNSTQLSKRVSAISLKTYAGALAAAQQQANGFAAEDSHFSGIEQSNQSITTVLQGQQLIVDAILALCQQVQLERQLLVTQITLEATKAGEELNERAQRQATLAQSNNFRGNTMKLKQNILIAAAVFVLTLIGVMWMEGWRVTPPSKNQPQEKAPFSEFKAPPDVHFTPLMPH